MKKRLIIALVCIFVAAQFGIAEGKGSVTVVGSDSGKASSEGDTPKEKPPQGPISFDLCMAGTMAFFNPADAGLDVGEAVLGTLLTFRVETTVGMRINLTESLAIGAEVGLAYFYFDDYSSFTTFIFIDFPARAYLRIGTDSFAFTALAGYYFCPITFTDMGGLEFGARLEFDGLYFDGHYILADVPNVRIGVGYKAAF